MLQAAAAPRRQAILRLVWDAERCAGDIHARLGDVTFGAVSQHLAVLERSGLVQRRVEGRRRFYRARREAMGPLRAWLEEMWADALYDLKLLAELEEARRGPRPAKTRVRRRRASER